MTENTKPQIYLVNEIYYTIQGEGVRYGIPHVFVRFAQCNLACGFCDTEFESYVEMTAPEILSKAQALAADAAHTQAHRLVEGARDNPIALLEPSEPCRNVLFCGGEPLLQLDETLIDLFKTKDDPWFIAIETNGTRAIPEGVDWTVCSPKVAEHAVKPEYVQELKYARAAGQGIPHPSCKAGHYLISPIFEGDALDGDNLAWCVQLVKENPKWRLTLQHHKTTFDVR